MGMIAGALGAALRGVRRGFDRRRGWSQNAQYVSGVPSAQQTIDIFPQAWSSRLPIEGVTAGESILFADGRIEWMLAQLGGVEGATVLELGPLEGGHTTMLERAGAARIDAIDANQQSYLKCLIVKELLGLTRAHFLLGEIEAYMAQLDRRYDLLLASGVLYHLKDPLPALLDMMRLADRLFIWSHFYDRDAMPASDPRHTPFTGEVTQRRIGEDGLTYHVRSYLGTSRLPKFCGGPESKAIWLERDEVILLLERHGFDVTVGLEEPQHVNGPAACLVARRRPAGA